MDNYMVSLTTAPQSSVPEIIISALNDEAVYHFGRLLNSPQVTELVATEQFAPYGQLLKLFSFGVLKDYKAKSADFPQLNAQQLNKLKLLTLVTLASNDKVLDYDQVISELDCSSEKEMEDLVIDAIYKNLISAKLDQKKRIVEVDFVVGRDVRSEDLQDIYNKLEAWSKTCEDALAGIGNDIEASNAAALAKREDNREFTKTLEELRASQQEPGGLPRTDSQYESTEYQREAERVKSNVP